MTTLLNCRAFATEDESIREELATSLSFNRSCSIGSQTREQKSLGVKRSAAGYRCRTIAFVALSLALVGCSVYNEFRLNGSDVYCFDGSLSDAPTSSSDASIPVKDSMKTPSDANSSFVDAQKKRDGNVQDSGPPPITEGGSITDSGLPPVTEDGSTVDSGLPPVTEDGSAADSGLPPITEDGSAADAGLPPDGSVADSGQTCITAAVEDFCERLPELSATQVIDGELDCGPPLLTVDPVGWNGIDPVPANHVTSFAAAWRPDGIYFYVEVRGQVPTPHPEGTHISCGDAIELYVDGDGTVNEDGSYQKPGTMQFIIAAPTSETPSAIEIERFVEGESQGNLVSYNFNTTMLSDGYKLEAFITAADIGLWTWPSSNYVGIDIAIDVSGAPENPNLSCGLRLGQYFLRLNDTGNSCKGEPWCDARAFCTPELVGG